MRACAVQNRKSLNHFIIYPLECCKGGKSRFLRHMSHHILFVSQLVLMFAPNLPLVETWHTSIIRSLWTLGSCKMQHIWEKLQLHVSNLHSANICFSIPTNSRLKKAFINVKAALVSGSDLLIVTHFCSLSNEDPAKCQIKIIVSEIFSVLRVIAVFLVVLILNNVQWNEMYKFLLEVKIIFVWLESFYTIIPILHKKFLDFWRHFKNVKNAII